MDIDTGSFYTLDITEVCSFRCLFCITRVKSPREGGRMSALSTVKKQLPLIRKRGYRTVCFTGGEPTLHPKLPEMVRAAGEAGLAAMINTHGMRFAEPRYLDAFRGLDFSCLLSFHSHKEAAYNRLTRTKGYARTVKGIRALLDRGVRVALSHVLSAHNYRDFPAWIAFVNRNFPRAAASVFFNQEEEGDGSMVRFSLVRPFLMKGLRAAKFPVTHLTACTASDCLIEEGFHARRENFSGEIRRVNLARLEALPLPLQKQLLNYFVPEKCYSCARFMNPGCKGIRKKYLLVFGHGEFAELMSAEEKDYVDALRRAASEGSCPPMRSSPRITLGRTGADAKSVIPVLGRILLDDLDHHIRREAALALGFLGAGAGEAVPALVRALKDSDPLTRRCVVHALAAQDAASAEAARALAGALADPDMEVRRYSALALSSRERLAGEAAAPLIKAVSARDAQTRRYAVLALGRVRPASRAAAGSLGRALRDRDSQVRAFAAAAFSRQPPPRPAAAALVRALADREGPVRREAAYALARMRRPPRAACGALVRALRDADPGTRASAALALSGLEPLPERAVAALARAMLDREGAVRREAVSALVKRRRPPAGAVAALVRALEDKDLHVRREAAAALCGMKPLAKPAAVAFVALLDDPDPQVRGNAALALSGK